MKCDEKSFLLCLEAVFRPHSLEEIPFSVSGIFAFKFNDEDGLWSTASSSQSNSSGPFQKLFLVLVLVLIPLLFLLALITDNLGRWPPCTVLVLISIVRIGRNMWNT
eukprot:scaffold601_cov170-Ochromonas_danica.AAC.27